MSEHLSLAHIFQKAAGDSSKVMLETFHALKHAIRFGAVIETVITDDAEKLNELIQTLAPDIADKCNAQVIGEREFKSLSPRALESHVIAIARRPEYSLSGILTRPGAVVALDCPTHAGNVGAVIRVAAAREIAGVVIIGEIDPWHPSVVRGGAGLQYAVPVIGIETYEALLSTERPLIALHEIGTPLPEADIPENAILIFGSERRGISTELRECASQTVMIPMQKGVSSLNLATSVAIALFHA